MNKLSLFNMKRYISYFIAGVLSGTVVVSFASAATLNLVTDKTQFAIGDTFAVDVKIDSENTGINGAQATVNYPVGILQETEIEKTNSVFTFWLKDPVADNSAGGVSFIGGSTSGVNGKSLQVAKINFKVVGSGTANLFFTDGAVTAADGNGTNVLSVMNGLKLPVSGKQTASTIVAVPTVSTSTSISAGSKPITRTAIPTGKVPTGPILEVPLYPVSGGWSNAEMPFIASWKLPLDVTGVATALNQQPTTNLQKTEGLFDNKTFPALVSDGTWYLHVRFKNDIGWSATTNYKINIDTIPPLAFSVTVKEGNSTYVTTPTIMYGTNDQPSGIKTYHILVDNSEVGATKETAFTLPSQPSGRHTVTIVAEDLAGNKTSTSVDVTVLEYPFLTIGGISLSTFQFFAILLLIFGAFVVGWWYSHYLWQKQLSRRILIAQRDVGDTLTYIEEETDKILDLSEGKGEINTKKANEIEFHAKKIKEKIEGAKKYIVENIREISRK